MSDVYQEWNEKGILRTKLLSISFLVRAGITLKEICKKEGITLKDLASLKEKYEDLADACDKKNINGLLFCIDNLVQMAEGYQMKREGREGYKSKNGQDKFKMIDVKIPVPKSLQANAYLLEKCYGKQWALDYERLALAEKKLENGETWEDELDGSENDIGK